MPNRLAQETSPYLQQHRDNPVDWYPWGAEAIAKARETNRPILLSIGYSACHWCHVMAHESFEDEKTAALMNQLYVNVKVDREERPDVDQLYQGVVQLMGRGGGWPLTVFLTPQLKPFYGGTYFPNVERYGMPSFTRLLTSLSDAWNNKRSDVEEQALSFERGLAHYVSIGLDGKTAQPKVADVVEAASTLAQGVDPKHGGFGTRGPKFPNPMNLALLLRGWRRSKKHELLQPAMLTLEKMALGGIYDQLGGGFHRYATDEHWLVPHFEKMLYDNAQLLHLYSEAFQLETRPLFAKVVLETADYVAREMTSPEGLFYAAQDADSEGEEGKFFVWHPSEIDAVLPKDEAELVKDVFAVKTIGNFEHGKTILEVTKQLVDPAAEAKLDAARAKLLEVRRKRIAPGLDDKALTGWNGLMIRGLAFASRVFAEPKWAAMAKKAADFALSKLVRPDGRLFRSFSRGEARHDGMIEDYGGLACGLVALYQATFEPKYLEAAESLSKIARELFWDNERKAYLSAPRGQPDLVVTPWAVHDNAVPSGASMLTEAQIGLAALTGRSMHLDHATAYLEAMCTEAVENPFGFGHLLLAMDDALDGAAELTLIASESERPAFLDVVRKRFAPTLHVCVHQTGPAPAVLAEQLQTRATAKGPAAYLCQRFACQLPVSTAAELTVVLDDARI
ncbi:MAG: thioredoxin domain-containing protein [Myxococcaceae bacterium]